MCIVYLNNRIVGKVIKIASFRNCLINDKLCRIADHKILLVYSKQLSLIITVIGIKEQCKIFSYIFFIEIYTVSLYNAVIHTVNIKKFQCVAFIVIACYIYLVHNRIYPESTKNYLITLVSSSKPALVLYPRIWHFFLKIFVKFLFKKSQMIIYSDTITI